MRTDPSSAIGAWFAKSVPFARCRQCFLLLDKKQFQTVNIFHYKVPYYYVCKDSDKFSIFSPSNDKKIAWDDSEQMKMSQFIFYRYQVKILNAEIQSFFLRFRT